MPSPLFNQQAIITNFSDFLRVFRFPLPVKLASRYNWTIVESGVKHHTLTLTPWNVLVHNLKFSLQKLLLFDYFNYVKIILLFKICVSNLTNYWFKFFLLSVLKKKITATRKKKKPWTFYYKFWWFSLFPAALYNVKALKVFIYLFHLTALISIVWSVNAGMLSLIMTNQKLYRVDTCNLMLT